MSEFKWRSPEAQGSCRGDPCPFQQLCPALKHLWIAMARQTGLINMCLLNPQWDESQRDDVPLRFPPAGRVQHCGPQRDSLVPVWCQGHLHAAVVQLLAKPSSPREGVQVRCFLYPSPPGQGTEEDHGFRQAQNTDQESRDQGWILAAGYTVRCSPSGTHVAPCFSRS